MTGNNNRNESIYNVLFLTVIFIAMSNFMLAGIYILLILGIFYLFSRKNHKIAFNKAVIPLLLFSLTYAIVTLIHGGQIISSIKVFVLPLIWIISYSEAKNKNISQIKKLFIILAFGMAMHGIINCLYNISIGNAIQTGRSYDIWSQAYSGATGQAVNFTLIAALSYWGIFLQKKSKQLSILLIITLIIAISYDIAIGGRTFLILTAIAITYNIVLTIITSIKDKTKRARVIPILLTICALVGSGIYLFNQNAFGMKSAYENSFLNKRITEYDGGNLSNDGRFSKKLNYISNAQKYPFGGNHLSKDEGFGFAHELWLDIYDDAGLIPYLFIVTYSIMAGIRFIKVSKDKEIDYSWRRTILLVLIISNLQFFVEPILSGSPIFLFAYIIMDSTLTRWLHDKKENS